MNNTSLGDVVFIILVLGIIYGCLKLARNAGKRKASDEHSDGSN